MTTLFFIWAILTAPADRYICDLWTQQINRAEFVAACGVDLLEGLRLDITQIDDGAPVCSVDAVYLNDIADVYAAASSMAMLKSHPAVSYGQNNYEEFMEDPKCR